MSIKKSFCKGIDVKKYSIILLFAFVIAMFSALSSVSAEDTALRHFLGEAVNTGRNNGYSGSWDINGSDKHFAWRLGRFCVSGYTRVLTSGDVPVFIRTLGDEVTLRFNLEQDIDNLNGSSSLIIANNNNAFDVHFGVERTDFGRGALIIRHTDWQNFTNEPTLYTDYLSAVIVGADTQVMFLEEGDYEVALNYAVNETGLFGTNLFDSTSNYRIFFRFSVRNGESMLFPRCIDSNDELTNGAVTENGFYIDMAMTRYLDIDIKRELLTQGADGLTLDTRFNRPARDGERYISEGVYTITAHNRYTNQQAVKQIYVSSNNVLTAFANSGLSLDEMNEQLAAGAYISEEGIIIQPLVVEPVVTEAEVITEVEVVTTGENVLINEDDTITDKTFSVDKLLLTVAVIILVLAVAVLYLQQKRKLKKNCCPNCEDGSVREERDDE
jgi:hypothetical protein